MALLAWSSLQGMSAGRKANACYEPQKVTHKSAQYF